MQPGIFPAAGLPKQNILLFFPFHMEADRFSFPDPEPDQKREQGQQGNDSLILFPAEPRRQTFPHPVKRKLEMQSGNDSQKGKTRPDIPFQLDLAAGIKENDPQEISQAPEVKLSLLTRQPGVPFEILSGKYRARREKQRNEEQKMVQPGSFPCRRNRGCPAPLFHLPQEGEGSALQPGGFR